MRLRCAGESEREGSVEQVKNGHPRILAPERLRRVAEAYEVDSERKCPPTKGAKRAEVPVVFAVVAAAGASLRELMEIGWVEAEAIPTLMPGPSLDTPPGWS